MTAGMKELNEMTVGRTDDPENPLRAMAFEAASLFGTGSRTPSGPAVMAPHEQAGHMIAIDPPVRLTFLLHPRGRSLIAPPLSMTFYSLLLPSRGHGSLRGRHGPPQHLVRSTGAAMSTTGSRVTHAAQRPPSQPACTLAPVGNSHSRQLIARADLVKVMSSLHALL